jgi:putative ABC transport system permease protein
MLLSIVNYINLSVAKAATREKEIAIQKVSGASRRSLTVQFLTETTLISFFAAITGLIIAWILLPGFSRFMNVNRSLGFSAFILLMIIPGVLLLGFVTGIYPAFMMSSHKITDIFTKRSLHGNRGLFLRYILIVFQFSVSMILISSTFLINKQVSFLKNKDPGIRTEKVIYAKLPFQIMRGSKEIFRDKVLELPDVQNVSFSSIVFGKIENLNSQEINGRVASFASIWVDAEFIDLYDLRLSRGRFFSKDFSSDVNTTALINESALKEFDSEDPFRIRIRVPGGEAKVVGIIRDFNFKSLHSRIEPLVIVFLPGQAGYVNIRIAGYDPRLTLNEIGKIWNDLAPGFPFSYQYLDSSLEKLYGNDERMGNAIMYFSLIAILIATIGILSLSLLICEKRIKEMGIHKINGATSWNLLLLMNKDFMLILLAAFVIACPVSWYAMHNWLERFAYKTSIGIWIYLASGFLVFMVTLTVVSWQNWRFAKRNPVDALRYE